LIVTLGRLTVDFDRESSISTEIGQVGAIDRHSGAIDRRIRLRVIDFDRESSISTEIRHVEAIDRHFGTTDNRFRPRVVDFDRDPSRWID
jgi:hypothetical protein